MVAVFVDLHVIFIILCFLKIDLWIIIEIKIFQKVTLEFLSHVFKTLISTDCTAKFSSNRGRATFLVYLPDRAFVIIYFVLPLFKLVSIGIAVNWVCV